MTGRALLATGWLAGAVLGAAGCGSSQGSDAGDAADSFHSAVSAGDGAAACGLLTPSARSNLEQSAATACDAAVLEELDPVAGSPASVSVFGNMAQARYASETTFLSRFRGGWRVTAAGCTRGKAQVYDCTVAGG
jgi:hypothetical protein